jgi:hypothetical protein
VVLLPLRVLLLLVAVGFGRKDIFFDGPPSAKGGVLQVLLSHLVVEVGTAGWSGEAPHRPVTGWRRRVQKLLIVSGRLAAFAAGFRIRVKGKRVSRVSTVSTVSTVAARSPDASFQADRRVAPILVAAPHSTFFDGMAVIFCDLPHIVSREENRRIPIFGKSLQFCQAIFVQR